MAEYVNNDEQVFAPGDYMVQYEMSAGTAKLQTRDNAITGSAFVDVPDSSKSASTSFIWTVGRDMLTKVVLTGDATCSISKV